MSNDSVPVIVQLQQAGISFPSPGDEAADYAIGAIYGVYASIVLTIAWRAFGRKKPIGSAFINLYFFALARCVGYILRGVVDGQVPDDTWDVSKFTTYAAMLTSAYSIITAGTTLFLFFMGVVSVQFRRTCEAVSPRGSDAEEENRERREGRFLWIFRIVVIALAVVAAIGSVREFNPYWFNYTQGKQMREAVSVIQIFLTLCMIVYVSTTFAAHRAPARTARAYLIANAIFFLMLITQGYNIACVVLSLQSKINTDPNYGYLLQVLPELLLLTLVLAARLDTALDYLGIRQERYAGAEYEKN